MKDIPSEGELMMPDGRKVSKEDIKRGLVESVADEFRNARNANYRSGDWIKYASEQVVNHLFEMDQYFDDMMELQKKMLANITKKNKPEPDVIGESADASKS